MHSINWLPVSLFLHFLTHSPSLSSPSTGLFYCCMVSHYSTLSDLTRGNSGEQQLCQQLLMCFRGAVNQALLLFLCKMPIDGIMTSIVKERPMENQYGGNWVASTLFCRYAVVELLICSAVEGVSSHYAFPGCSIFRADSRHFNTIYHTVCHYCARLAWQKLPPLT